jgi:hypothetical protein
MQKNPFVITSSVLVVVAVVALAVLGVLSAFAGEKSGLDKSGRQHCPTLSAKAARDVSDAGYGKRLAQLARCS